MGVIDPDHQRARLVGSICGALVGALAAIPYSAEFTVVDVIDGYDYGPFGQRRDKNTWRRLHDLIAFASRLVEYTVRVAKGSAGPGDRCAGLRD